MNVYQERQYCPSRFIVTGSPTPYRRSHSISTDGRQGGAAEAVIAKGGDAGGHHQGGKKSPGKSLWGLELKSKGREISATLKKPSIRGSKIKVNEPRHHI